MRLDLVLKLSGLIKRRTIAKELADRGRILINNRVAKPSSEVKAGDILELRLGNRVLVVEISFEERYKREFPVYKEVLTKKVNSDALLREKQKIFIGVFLWTRLHGLI